MSWTNNQSIRFQLGTIALWNLLTKKVVDAKSPALGLLMDYFDRAKDGIEVAICKALREGKISRDWAIYILHGEVEERRQARG